MIRLGYACINTQLESPNRTCRLSNATPDRILELGRANLQTLEGIVRWNQAHGIQVFRISSETIPLASHPVNRDLPWWEIMQPELSRLADAIRAARLRISAHPGQYTVLNSPRPEVVESSRVELDYHARLLESLGGGPEAKIVLHLGGVYGDKPASLARFIDNFARLPEGARRRLVLENDEKSYTLADALFVSQRTGAPVVFDIFHHTWNPSLDGQPLTELIRLAGQTWSAADGRQKIHYSNPWPGKPKGSHSQSVDVDAFAEFYAQVRDLDLDIMLEVKDKQESVLALYERFPELKPA